MRKSIFRVRRHRACLSTIAVSAAVLGACAGNDPVTIDRTYVTHVYSRSLVVGANQYDSTKLEVVGQPFGAPAERVQARVRESIQGIGLLDTIDLTTGRADARSPYRLIVQFAPARDLNHFRVCKGQRKTRSDARGAPVSLMMTYCLGDDPVTSLRARRGGISSLADPRFDDLLRQAAKVAFMPGHEALRAGPDGGNGGSFP